MKYAVIIAMALFVGTTYADVLVSLNASTQVDGADFATNYGGGIGTGNNVTFSGSAAITNGQISGSTTYSAPDVYVASSKSSFTGNFGVAEYTSSGWRIRLNTVPDGEHFFSDNLFAVDSVSLDDANDTMNAASIFVSDMAAISNAQVRFVIQEGGAFYISEPSANFQSGALDGNFTTNCSIEALSANWFEYNPTVNPTVNGVADIGPAATPSFSAITFVGFHMEVTTYASGTIAAHNGCNIGVREFIAQGVGGVVSSGWYKRDFFEFDDVAGKSFNTFINSGSLNSSWNFGGPAATIFTDGAGSLAISNHPGQTYRKLDEYVSPYTSGVYRLEMDLASWDLDSTAVGSTLTFGALSDVTDGASLIAAVRLTVQDATTAKVQMFGDFTSGATYRAFNFNLDDVNGLSCAIEFDFDANTATYLTNGVVTHSFTDFQATRVESLQLNTSSSWSTGSFVAVNEMGLSEFVEAPPVDNTPASRWNAWLDTYPGIGVNTNLLDNGDSDELDNLTEYAFGGDPSDGGSLGNVPVQALVNDGGSNYIEYIYFERDDAGDRGLASILTVGTDLVVTNWADASGYEAGRGTSGVSGFNAVTNRIPTGSETKQFIRLQIKFTP